MASSMRDHRGHRDHCQHNIQHQRELVRMDHHPSNQHTSREVAVVGQVPTGTRGGDNPTMIDSSLLSSSSSSLSNVYYRRSMLPNNNNNKGKNEDDKEEEGLVEEKQNRSRGYVVNVNRNNNNTVNSNNNSNTSNNSSSRRYHPSIDHTNWSSTSNSTYNIRKKDNNDSSGIHISNHHSHHHGEYRYNSDNSSNNNDNNNSNGYDRVVHNTIPNDRYRRDNEGNRNVSSSMMNHRHSITGIGIRSASESEQQRQGAYHTNNSYRNTDTREKNNNSTTSYSTSDNRSYNNYTNNNNDDRERHVNGTRESYNNYQQDRGDQQRYQQRDDGQYRYSRPRYSMGGQNNATINNNNNSVDNSSNTNLNNYRRGSYIEYNNNNNNNRGGRRGGEHHHPQIKTDQRRWSIPQHQSRSYMLPSRNSSISSKNNADRNSDNKEYKNNANSGYGRNDTTQRNSKNKTATDYYEMTSRTLGNSTREYEAVNNTICGGREEKYHRDWNERREITNALSPPPSTFSASSILMESRRRDEEKRQNNASLSLSRSRYSWSEEDHRDASGNNGNQQPSSSMIQSIPNNQNSASKLSSTDRIQGEIPFHSTRDKGMDVKLGEESGKNRRAKLFGTPAGIDVELSNMASIQNDQDPLASIPETRNEQLSKQQIFSLPQSSSILSSENIDSNSKKRRHEDEPEIKLDISSKHNNNRDQYLPPEKRFRLENDKVVSNVPNSTKNDPESNISRSSPFQQSLDQRTNKGKSTIDAGKSTIQESITKKTEVLSSNSLTIAVMSTASLEKKSKTDAPYQLTNDLNNGTDKLLRQGKNKNIVAGTKLISTSSSFVVKKKVPIKPSINKMGIPMSWLKPKVKPVPKKKKIALPPPPPPPPPKSTTAKKNPAARPLSPSSKDNNKGLVTDSSEGGSIVSYRNNNAVILSGSSTNSSSQKQKRGSVPSAIVTKKNKKTKKNAQGADCNELSDHSNKEVLQDGWNSEAEESEPEESDVDDDDDDDFQSDVEDREVNNLSSSSSPPKSTKLKIRLSSAKLEQLSKSRLVTEPLGNHDITDSNDDENIKTEASLKREKRKQEKLMALSIMMNKRPDFDHEKAKKKMEEEKRKREESKPLTAKQIRQILRTDDRSNLNPNNWVRRSRRQPNKAILKSKPLRMLIGKLKMNDSEMNVLKMKKYINDPNIPSAALDSALDAMEENTNCQVLYIQNFNEGMRDQQVLHLLRILQQPSCNIWCLNIGENYNVSDKTWEKFTKGLIHTKITHMYASEHTITTDMKDEIRFTIRENRKKHDMHINPNNLNVIIQCTHCWWNPINAKVLRPYLKKQGFEHVLNDTEAQGLRGSHSAAPTK